MTQQINSDTTFTEWIDVFNRMAKSVGDTARFSADGTMAGLINSMRSDIGNDSVSNSYVEEINEMDALLGTQGSSPATTRIAAIKNKTGSATLPYSASNQTDALKELDQRLGTGNYNTAFNDPSADVTVQLNELKDDADTSLGHIGGTVADDYTGDGSSIIQILNSIADRINLTHLNATYASRTGATAMLGALDISSRGITSSTQLKFSTQSSQNAMLLNTTGHIGFGKHPHATHDIDVQGNMNATALLIGGQDISSQFVASTVIAGIHTVQSNVNFTGSLEIDTLHFGDFTIADSTRNYLGRFQDLTGEMFSDTDITASGGAYPTYSTGKINLTVDGVLHTHQHAQITDLTESAQDTAGAMVSGNTESGISVAYNDSTGKLNFTVLPITDEAVQDATGAMVSGNTESGIAVTYDDSSGKLNFTVQPITDEAVQDATGAMVSGNTESGISVTYNNSTGKLNFDVSDPTIALAGDVTGSAQITNLSNATITASLNPEAIQDIVGTMFTSNTETGITANYQDSDGTIDLAVDNDYIKGIAGGMVTGNTEVGLTATYQSSDKTIDFAMPISNTAQPGIARFANTAELTAMTANNIIMSPDDIKTYIDDRMNTYAFPTRYTFLKYRMNGSKIQAIFDGELQSGTTYQWQSSDGYKPSDLSVTVNGAVNSGSNSIVLDSTTGISVGDSVQIGNDRYEITAIASNTLTLMTAVSASIADDTAIVVKKKINRDWLNVSSGSIESVKYTDLTVNGSVSSGATTITVDNATGIDEGDYYGTGANERQITAISGTTLTLASAVPAPIADDSTIEIFKKQPAYELGSNYQSRIAKTVNGAVSSSTAIVLDDATDIAIGDYYGTRQITAIDTTAKRLTLDSAVSIDDNATIEITKPARYFRLTFTASGTTHQCPEYLVPAA